MQKLALGTVQFGVNYGINSVAGQVKEKEVPSIQEMSDIEKELPPIPDLDELKGKMPPIKKVKLEELPPTVESNLTALIKAIENGIDVTRRIQGDRNTSQKQNGIDLNDVVKASVKTTQPKWQDEVRRRGCAVEVVLDLQANQKTRGAASLLDEVLINLIFNAADAMHSGGTLTISTWQDQDWGYVSVSDTGVGMDQETQDRIGELFFTTKPTGHGIGLATCYHLISQIGGCVQVKSTLDEGTTFTVQIPLEQSTDP